MPPSRTRLVLDRPAIRPLGLPLSRVAIGNLAFMPPHTLSRSKVLVLAFVPRSNCCIWACRGKRLQCYPVYNIPTPALGRSLSYFPSLSSSRIVHFRSFFSPSSNHG